MLVMKSKKFHYKVKAQMLKSKMRPHFSEANKMYESNYMRNKKNLKLDN